MIEFFPPEQVYSPSVNQILPLAAFLRPTMKQACSANQGNLIFVAKLRLM